MKAAKAGHYCKARSDLVACLLVWVSETKPEAGRLCLLPNLATSREAKRGHFIGGDKVERENFSGQTGIKMEPTLKSCFIFSHAAHAAWIGSYIRR